jgi:hypothetical protein
MKAAFPDILKELEVGIPVLAAILTACEVKVVVDLKLLLCMTAFDAWSRKTEGCSELHRTYGGESHTQIAARRKS